MSEQTPEPGATAAREGAASDPRLAKWIGLGVGAGIGSAAIAAALLYASRSTRRKAPRG